jgi:uncharacterized protein YecT (DUF1311 family)
LEHFKMDEVQDWIFLASLIAFISFAGHAWAEEVQAESCDGSTYEMVECLTAKIDQWDKQLNRAYQQALKDAETPAQADQLRAAQRLWVQYRDANCRYYDLGGGTIARVNAGECMRSMTEARTKELEGVGRR